MLKKIFFIGFILCTFSCVKRMDKPNDLINRERFKSIITQIYLYKQAPSSLIPHDLQQPNLSLAVLKKNHTSPEQFKKSLEYYMLNNDELSIILKEIQDSIREKLPENSPENTTNEDVLIQENP